MVIKCEYIYKFFYINIRNFIIRKKMQKYKYKECHTKICRVEIYFKSSLHLHVMSYLHQLLSVNIIISAAKINTQWEMYINQKFLFSKQ